ncbi:hypothetical protein [Salipiger mucosus]|uniref:Uncharacterized protein n=1 Tax=Salipiger mucosus DSM 16094 TaxID=1123237 RepID=S9QWW9_9RHOB|nr:hypothetical protein [Salipiger mucosus]EPX84067.1 hypothetical protein Salmuc_01842 [Salipiger mucosus DSM 16094]
MTNTREENVADLTREEADQCILAAAVEKALDDNPDYEDVAREQYAADEIDFDEWCAELGVDPSFVGTGADRPGYGDIFDAAVERVQHAPNLSSP